MCLRNHASTIAMPAGDSRFVNFQQRLWFRRGKVGSRTYRMPRSAGNNGTNLSQFDSAHSGTPCYVGEVPAHASGYPLQPGHDLLPIIPTQTERRYQKQFRHDLGGPAFQYDTHSKMLLTPTPPSRIRTRAAASSGATTGSSLHPLRTALRSAAADLERAKGRCNQLLRECAPLPDRTAERLTLHLGTRLDGLTRQVEESLLILEQISAIVGDSSGTRTDGSATASLRHGQHALPRDQSVAVGR